MTEGFDIRPGKGGKGLPGQIFVLANHEHEVGRLGGQGQKKKEGGQPAKELHGGHFRDLM
jgi:hypothetical protein